MEEIIDTFEGPYFGRELSNGDRLEKYVIEKFSNGDFVITIGIGNRMTGGEFKINFGKEKIEGKTFEEIVNILPGYGVSAEEQLADERLKKFFGFL